MKLHSIGYLLKEGVRNTWTNRTMSLASVGVLIACLLLTGSALMLSANISLAMASVEDSNSVTVYLKDDLPSLTSVEVGEKIRGMENVAECEYVPKDEALGQIMASLGDDGTVFQGLTGNDNFLPDAYKVSLRDLSQYEDTVDKISQLDGVDSITDYSDIADKLSRLDKMVQIGGTAIVVILGIVSLFIISNTVRVTMYTRRMEISIMKSVGATNLFIRVPFIVEGMVIGLISGLISGLLLYFAYGEVTMAITNILPFFQPASIDTMFWPVFGGFLVSGVLFGMMGGILSIGKYLKREGEEVI